jgi:hypothetical protein
MEQHAKILGYPCYAWNGLVYDTSSSKPIEGITMEDVN